jgi:hypothetical protein
VGRKLVLDFLGWQHAHRHCSNPRRLKSYPRRAPDGLYVLSLARRLRTAPADSRSVRMNHRDRLPPQLTASARMTSHKLGEYGRCPQCDKLFEATVTIEHGTDGNVRTRRRAQIAGRRGSG